MASLAMEQYLRNLMRDQKIKHKKNKTCLRDDFSSSSGSSSSSHSNNSRNHDDFDDDDDDETSFGCENLTIVADNAHLPAHCFFGNGSYWDEMDHDDPTVAFSQSLSAISTLSFPPAFLLQQQSSGSSSRWSCDESQSSGLDFSLVVPSRSRDCDSPRRDSRPKPAPSTSSSVDHKSSLSPPTKTASLDSTTKWLRELPVDPPQTPLRRGCSRCVDTPPLTCVKSPGEYEELPSLIECLYCDEDLDIHPQRQRLGSLDGLKNKHEVAALSCPLLVSKREDEREKNRCDTENEFLHFSDDEDEILLRFLGDEGEEKDGEYGEVGEDEPPEAGLEQPEDDLEDCSYSSFRNDGKGSSSGFGLVNFELTSPTPTKMDTTIRHSPLLSHVSPRGIGDFPYSPSTIVFPKGGGETMVTHNSPSTKSPSSGSTSSSSSSSSASIPSVLNRHLQLTKKLSVVFEQEEIERFVEVSV